MSPGESAVVSCRGPDTYTRSIAAYQLLTCASLIRHPFLTEAVPFLLVPLLSAFSDPAPFAQVCASHTLTHLTRHATAASLHCQRDILVHVITRCMTGCDASVWPAVLPCSLALALRLDSVTGGADCQLAALTLALTEAKRGGHDAAVRRPFLACLIEQPGHVGSAGRGGLVAGIGVRIVGLFRLLMPLLLDWMQVEDAAGLDLLCQVRNLMLHFPPPQQSAASVLRHTGLPHRPSMRLREAAQPQQSRVHRNTRSFTASHACRRC